MKVEEKGNDIVITIPRNKKPVPSASGKTLIVASSHGNVPTSLQHNGDVISAGVNVFARNPEYTKPASS